MNLAGLFGDDEHTAADDPYQRALRSRKWLVGAAFGAWLVGSQAFDPAIVNVGIGTVAVSEQTWLTVTWYSMIYTLAFYTLVIVQLSFRYDALLKERLIARTIDKLGPILTEWATINELQATKLAKRPRTESTRAEHGKELNNILRRMKLLDDRLMLIEGGFSTHRFFVAAEVFMDMMRLGLPVAAAAIAIIAWK